MTRAELTQLLVEEVSTRAKLRDKVPYNSPARSTELGKTLADRATKRKAIAYLKTRRQQKQQASSSGDRRAARRRKEVVEAILVEAGLFKSLAYHAWKDTPEVHTYIGAGVGAVTAGAANRVARKYYDVRRKKAKPGSKQKWLNKRRSADRNVGAHIAAGYGVGAAAGLASAATAIGHQAEGPNFSWKRTGKKMGDKTAAYARRNIHNAKSTYRASSNRRKARSHYRNQTAAGVTRISRPKAKRYNKNITMSHGGLLRSTNH